MSTLSQPPEAGERRSAPPRVGRGELVSAASALALLICIFAFAWFGMIGRPAAISGVGRLGSEDGWTGLGAGRWLMVLCILVALGTLALHISQSGHGTKTDTGPLTLLIAVPTALLIAVRVLIDLPSPDRVVDAKLGGYVGALLCTGVALGGWQTLQEERERRAAQARAASHRPSPPVSPPRQAAAAPRR